MNQTKSELLKNYQRINDIITKSDDLEKQKSN